MSTSFICLGGEVSMAVLKTVSMDENSSAVMTRVQAYIDMNIYNSAVWDSLEDKQKLKAIYNSYRILVTILPDIFDNTDASTIDLDDLVAEIMWLIKRDDSTDRADQGATMITLGDMSMQFDSSKTGVMIAPEIITRYDLSASGQRRRVGRYVLPLEDTARTGFYLGDKERFRHDK